MNLGRKPRRPKRGRGGFFISRTYLVGLFLDTVEPPNARIVLSDLGVVSIDRGLGQQSSMMLLDPESETT